MSFISTANHVKFCNNLQDSITRLEKIVESDRKSPELLAGLRKDLEFLNRLFLEYNNKLNEINRIITNYANVEKRARSVLRQHRRALEKMKENKLVND